MKYLKRFESVDVRFTKEEHDSVEEIFQCVIDDYDLEKRDILGWSLEDDYDGCYYKISDVYSFNTHLKAKNHFLCFRIWFRYDPNLLSDAKIKELEMKLNNIKDDVELVSKRLNSIGFDYKIEFRRIVTNSFPIININITRKD